MNFHLPFPSPLLCFKIIFDFFDAFFFSVTFKKIHPPFQNPGSAPGTWCLICFLGNHSYMYIHINDDTSGRHPEFSIFQISSKHKL